MAASQNNNGVVAIQDGLIEGLRIGRHPDKTRLVFDLSRTVTYRYERLKDEVILEMDWPVDQRSNIPAKTIEQLNPDEDVVHRIMLQQQSVGGARVAITVDPSVRVESFDLQPHAGRSHRLVVDVYAQKTLQSGVKSSTAAIVGSTVSASPSVSVVKDDQHASAPIDHANHTASSANRSAKKEVPVVASAAFSGTWEHEWGINTHSNGSQKFESTIEPEWSVSFVGGMRALVSGRARLDGVGDLGPSAYKSFNYSAAGAPLYNTAAASITLREMYLDIPVASTFLRVGKQQVVWGESDGIKVLDVVNPQSFREFILDDFEDSRIPLWMANWEVPLGESANLQLLWIPDLTYDELAEVGTPFFVTAPQLVPDVSEALFVQLLEPRKPDDIWRDADWGVKLSSLLGSWDVSLQYLYQYADTPVFYSYRSDEGATVVAPEYERTHLVGSTFSNTFGDITLRTELAYKSDTYQISDQRAYDGIEKSSEFSSVIGLDWQASSDLMMSAQWFYSFLFDYQRSIVREESEQLASLLLQANFDNASWQFQALGLYSLNNHDALFQLKLRYWLESNVEIWVGSDIFHGTQRGLFGQFDQRDRVLLGFTYGF